MQFDETFMSGRKRDLLGKNQWDPITEADRETVKKIILEKQEISAQRKIEKQNQVQEKIQKGSSVNVGDLKCVQSLPETRNGAVA